MHLLFSMPASRRVDCCIVFVCAFVTAVPMVATVFYSYHLDLGGLRVHLQQGQFSASSSHLRPFSREDLMSRRDQADFYRTNALGPYRWWFQWYRSQRSQWIAIPLWVLPVAGILGPRAWFRVRGVVRSRRGLCSACAYSLRGLPVGTACPECGRASRVGAVRA